MIAARHLPSGHGTDGKAQEEGFYVESEDTHAHLSKSRDSRRTTVRRSDLLFYVCVSLSFLTDHVHWGPLVKKRMIFSRKSLKRKPRLRPALTKEASYKESKKIDPGPAHSIVSAKFNPPFGLPEGGVKSLMGMIDIRPDITEPARSEQQMRTGKIDAHPANTQPARLRPSRGPITTAPCARHTSHRFSQPVSSKMPDKER